MSNLKIVAPGASCPSHRDSEPERLFQRVTFAIFAYNEEAAIRDSIASALAAGRKEFATHDVEVIVLANGCKDHTADRVRDMAAHEHTIKLVELRVGDKATTWNRYVHEFADLSCPRRLHVFMDGDVTCTDNVIQRMHSALRSQPASTACCVLPAKAVGRNRELNILLYNRDGAVFGNQYGLTNDLLQRLRAAGIRIPAGAVGEDAYITEMVALDLDRNNVYDNRKAACADIDSGFIYESLSYFRLADIRLQLNRLVRYQIRNWRLPILRKINFRDFPATMQPVDQQILKQLHGRLLLNPIQWLARRRLQLRQTTSFSKSKTARPQQPQTA